MRTKATLQLAGRVDKIISRVADIPERLQIVITDGEDLYREIRVENRFLDSKGNVLFLRVGDPVTLTIEARLR
jgi:hypothetical protein